MAGWKDSPLMGAGKELPTRDNMLMGMRHGFDEAGSYVLAIEIKAEDFAQFKGDFDYQYTLVSRVMERIEKDLKEK